MSNAKNEVNYANLYKILFRAQTQAIEILQKAQRETEKIYINTPIPKDKVTNEKEYSN